MNKEMRFTEEELSLIKSMYQNNDKGIKLLRKVFLPELTADAPLGQNLDLWMTVKIEDLTPEQALINIKARNTVIGHLESMLIQLQTLANREDEVIEGNNSAI